MIFEQSTHYHSRASMSHKDKKINYEDIPIVGMENVKPNYVTFNLGTI